MAKKKTVSELSADELYALAEKKQQEEAEAEREATRSMIEELRNKRRELVAKQRKELAAIDAKIRKLGGRTKAKSRSKGSVSSEVVAIIEAAGKISTKDIKAKLEAKGISTGNLSQTLAYLKRTGRLASPSRSMYTLA